MKRDIFSKRLRVGVICLIVLSFLIPTSSSFNIKNAEVSKSCIFENNNGSLSGWVNDPLMDPIEGALIRVYFHGTYEEDYSDENGFYHVTNIPICYCMKNCTCSKEGYKTEWILMGITENSTYDFILYPDGVYPVFNGSQCNGWWNSPIIVSFVFDPEEVAEIWYDYHGWRLYTEPFVVDENGFVCIDFYWINHEGEQSPIASFCLDIDQIPPETDLEWETYRKGGWYVKFIFSAVDDISGMHDVVKMYINDRLHETVTGPGPVYEFIIAWNVPMNFVAKFVCHDNAGNEAFESINDSDIKSHNTLKNSIAQNSYNFYFQWILERFPLLQRLFEIVGRNA